MNSLVPSLLPRTLTSFLFAPLLAVALALGASSAQSQNGPGSVDYGFTLGGFSDITGSFGVFSVAEQTDGKILIGGVYSGRIAGPLNRVNPDGSLDSAFQRPVIESYNTRTDTIITKLDPDYVPVVRIIKIQSDGKILVGGNFYFVNGLSGFGGLVRLNSDGSVDTGFTAPRFAGTVAAIALASNGEVLVGGDFDQVDTTSKNCLVKLKSNGKLDKDFNPGVFTPPVEATGTTVITPAVAAIATQADGKIIIGGLFSAVDNRSRPGLARLGSDGSVDSGYLGDGSDPLGVRADVNNQVLAITSQKDGKMIVGGQVSGTASGALPNSLVRVNQDGSLDSSFNQKGVGTAGGAVDIILVDRQGRILVGGGFTSYNGVGCSSLARLLSNGAFDPSFNIGSGASSAVFGLALQADDKLLVSGYFTFFEQSLRIFVARLDTEANTEPDLQVSLDTVQRVAELGPPTRKAILNVTRIGGNQGVDLTVYYQLSGLAENGVNYRFLPGSITIPAGHSAVRLKIRPLEGPTYKRVRKVTVTLSNNNAGAGGGFLEGGYAIAGPGARTVKIIDEAGK